MVQFLSIIFFSWISSIFVGFFKSSLFCVTLYILIYISNKMQRYTVYLFLETALHVLGGISTHHQEHIQMYLQHLELVTPLLLPVAIVEELERSSNSSTTQIWIIKKQEFRIWTEFVQLNKGVCSLVLVTTVLISRNLKGTGENMNASMSITDHNLLTIFLETKCHLRRKIFHCQQKA